MAELLYGAHRSNNVAQNLAKVRAFSAPFISLSFDDAAAEEYGKIRAHLEGLGNVIDPNDLMIAATALAHGLILVTHNVGEFGGAPGLVVEDWQTGP